MDFLCDRSFLLKVNRHKVKRYYVAITCLDFETEKPLATLQGKVVSGNIAIAANSPTRRTASLSIIFDKTTYNIVDVNNLIAINKKISLTIKIENPLYHTEEYRKYGETLDFKQGVFMITKASSSITTSALSVNVSLSDKMALLDGTCGGTLPASVSFHDKVIVEPNGDQTIEYPIIIDIIKECVHHFGGEHYTRIQVDDVPQTGRIVIRYIGDTPINFATIPDIDDQNNQNGYKRAPGGSFCIAPPPVAGYQDTYIKGDNIGYKETPLTYPGELIMKAGTKVTGVLDEIVKALGNFQYFYDTEGVFHFCKKANFLATGNTPLNLSPQEDAVLQALYCPRYSPSLLLNEFLDAELVSNISFSPNYSNIKNDFVYWGTRKSDKNDETMVRYHLAIDKRPEDIPKPKTVDEWAHIGQNYSLCHDDIYEVRSTTDDSLIRYQRSEDLLNPYERRGECVAPSLDTCFPNDTMAWFNWREELYRIALLAYGSSTSGSYYDEELLAEWRLIFDPTSTEDKGKDSFEKKWHDKFGDQNTDSPWRGYKVDVYTNPEKLRFWLDIIDTDATIGQYSVSRIGRRTKITEDSKVNEVFSREIHDIVFIEAPIEESEWEKVMDKVKEEYIPIGQTYSFVQNDQWAYFQEVNSFGTCYEGVRQQLYESVYYNSTISLTCIPIFYLDGNQCIRINFPEFGITGDYIVNSISYSLNNNPSMTLGLQEAMVLA